MKAYLYIYIYIHLSSSITFTLIAGADTDFGIESEYHRRNPVYSSKTRLQAIKLSFIPGYSYIPQASGYREYFG